MATARKTTTKTTTAKTTKPADNVTKAELTQITKALATLTKEVKTLKAQLAEAKLQTTTQTTTTAADTDVESLKQRLVKYAEFRKDQKLTWFLTTGRLN